MTIRKAQKKDIPAVMRLLGQVLDVHAKLRPDIFRAGTTKYTPAQLEALFSSETTPVFVATDEKGAVTGHVFCVLKQAKGDNLIPRKTLFIDDLCVDETARGTGVGRALFAFALDFARHAGCYDVALNVWEGNPARAFYEKMGMFVKETQMETIL